MPYFVEISIAWCSHKMAGKEGEDQFSFTFYYLMNSLQQKIKLAQRLLGFFLKFFIVLAIIDTEATARELR